MPSVCNGVLSYGAHREPSVHAARGAARANGTAQRVVLDRTAQCPTRNAADECIRAAIVEPNGRHHCAAEDGRGGTARVAWRLLCGGSDCMIWCRMQSLYSLLLLLCRQSRISHYIENGLSLGLGGIVFGSDLHCE